MFILSLPGMIYWGMGAANALEALVHEMKDPEHVEEMFNKFDHNGNGRETMIACLRLTLLLIAPMS